MVSVYCNMSMGGYTRIMNKVARITGYFQKNWNSYKIGFNDNNGNYWMGLDNMNIITNNQNFNLYIELHSIHKNISNITYSSFKVDSEINKYKLTLGPKVDGNLGDFYWGHTGNNFTTIDQDNDSFGAGSCSSSYVGGWWFGACFSFCLTCEGSIGQYLRPGCSGNICFEFYEYFKMLIIPSTL